MQKYDVLIATPGSSLEPQYVKSLVKTLEECNKRGITYKWLNSYSSLVHHARELTASGTEGNLLDPNQKTPGGEDIEYKKIFWMIWIILCIMKITITRKDYHTEEDTCYMDRQEQEKHL